MVLAATYHRLPLRSAIALKQGKVTPKIPPPVGSRVNHGGFFESINRVLTEVTVMSALTSFQLVARSVLLKTLPANAAYKVFGF